MYNNCNASVRLCKPRLLVTEGGCSGERLHQCHESGFPQPFAGREGGEDRGQGQWKISYSSAGLLGTHKPLYEKKKKNLWILYAEVGRSICIIAEHKGMRSSLVPIVAGWVHIGCLEPASLKTCHHPAPTANNQGLFADLKRSSLVFMGKYLWL